MIGKGRSPTKKNPTEGWIARHVRIARQIGREPHSAFALLRGAAVALWVARGGGFYGLGCVVAFIALEVRTFTTELAASTSVSDFITSQALEYVLRIGFMSFLNGFLALIWPVYLLDWLGVPGVLILAGGYLVFEQGLQPIVEGHVPELKTARDMAVLKKRQKAAAKLKRSPERAAKRPRGPRAR